MLNDELEVEQETPTDEDYIQWGKENYQRMLRTEKYSRPLSRIIAVPKKTDYWKSAFAKVMAEMEKQ